MYAIQDVAGKGKGLLATRNIAMGTRILSEEPVIRFREMAFSTDSPALRKSIRKQVDTLTHGQRQAFLSMHNIYDDDDAARPLGIIRTNGLPFGNDEGGIFLEACRINHTCDNNAQKSWNENIKRHTIHAMRDIEEGEEITITYLGVLNKRDIRQEKLRQKFAFKCVCGLCALPPAASQESDRRLEEIINLDNLIGQNGAMAIMTAPARMLRKIFPLSLDNLLQLSDRVQKYSNQINC